MSMVAACIDSCVLWVYVLFHWSGCSVFVSVGRVDWRSGTAGNVRVPLLYVAQDEEAKEVQRDVGLELVLGDIGGVFECGVGYI